MPFPVFIMEFFADMLGIRDLANRLFGSLQVYMSNNYDLLGWTPVVTIEEQLAKIFKKI